ncbi:MAG: hypothetical protein R3E89_00650 [Thiolinea sp.]
MSCLLPPVCAFCEHLLNESDRDCRAFKEIPETIMLGSHSHDTHLPDDQGYLFQLNPQYREDFEELNTIRQEMGLPVLQDHRGEQAT